MTNFAAALYRVLNKQTWKHVQQTTPAEADKRIRVLKSPRPSPVASPQEGA